MISETSNITVISYDNIESENEKENKLYNLFFVISDELYNYIFSFKNIFILSDIYIYTIFACNVFTYFIVCHKYYFSNVKMHG